MVQILDCSSSMNVLIGAVKFILNLIRWLIPVVLIILGSIDMFKAMASNDEKKAGEARKTFIRRLVYAVVAFLIPFIITFAFDIVGQIVADSNPNTNDIHNDNLKNGNFFECWYNGGSSNSNNSNNNNNDSSLDYVSCWKQLDTNHWQDLGGTQNTCTACWGTFDYCSE